MASKTRACQCCRPLLKQPQKGGKNQTIPQPSAFQISVFEAAFGASCLLPRINGAKQSQLKFLSPDAAAAPPPFFFLQPPPPPSHRPSSNLIFSRDWVPSSSARARMTFLLKPFSRKLLYCFRTVGWVCVQEFDPSSALARRKVIESWSLCSKRNLNDGPR